jgi:hypothetical protein
MVTISRGVRVSEKQFSRIYDVWQLVRKDATVQVNQVITVLLELGLMTFPKLSEGTQRALFRQATAKQEVQLRAKVERNVTDVAGKFRLDDRLAFALPTDAKRQIRQEARRAGQSMSAVARQRIIVEGLAE